MPLLVGDLFRLVCEAPIREYVVQGDRFEAIDQQECLSVIETLQCCDDVGKRFAADLTDIKHLIVVSLCGTHTLVWVMISP
jgi:hypothetical protein